MSKKTLYLVIAIIVIMFFTRIYIGEKESETIYISQLQNGSQATDSPAIQTEDSTQYVDYNTDIDSGYWENSNISETTADYIETQQETAGIYNYDTTASDMLLNTDGIPDSPPVITDAQNTANAPDINNITDITSITDITDVTSPDGTADGNNTTDITNFTNITVPYTLDEIKTIYDESKDLFEKVKDICLSSGYGATIYVADASSPMLPGVSGPGIYFRAAGQNDYTNVNQIDGYEAITELFNKYNILGVNSYNYTDHYTKQIQSGVVFQMLSCLQYEQDIMYSESTDSAQDVTDENTEGIMTLDANWYYQRINHQ